MEMKLLLTIATLLSYSLSAQVKAPIKKNSSNSQSKIVKSNTIITVVTPTLSLKEKQVKHLKETIDILLKFPALYDTYDPFLYKAPLLEFTNHTDSSVIVLHQNYQKHTIHKLNVMLDSTKIKRIDVITMKPGEKMKYKYVTLVIYKFEYNGDKINNIVAIQNGEESFQGAYFNINFHYNKSKIDSVNIINPNYFGKCQLYLSNGNVDSIYTSWSRSFIKYGDNKLVKNVKHTTSPLHTIDYESTIFDENLIINETRNIFNNNYPVVKINHVKYQFSQNKLDTMSTLFNDFGKEDEDITNNPQILPTKEFYVYNEINQIVGGKSEYHDKCSDRIKTFQYFLNEFGFIYKQGWSNDNKNKCQY